jgi:saccharopine dehydrogenase-like NADP-dependent oxidoreductase
MRVLLVGVGGVGEAIAAIAKPHDWMELMVLADFNVKRAEEVQKKLGDSERFPLEFIDASSQENIESLAKKYNVDLIMNAVDPIFNQQIFDAAYIVGAKYIDMAMTLSEPHPTDPFHKTGVKLGDYQFDKAADWKRKACWRWSASAWNRAWQTCSAVCPGSSLMRSKRSAFVTVPIFDRWLRLRPQLFDLDHD